MREIGRFADSVFVEGDLANLRRDTDVETSCGWEPWPDTEGSSRYQIQIDGPGNAARYIREWPIRDDHWGGHVSFMALQAC